MMWYLQAAAAVAAVILVAGPMISKLWTAILVRAWEPMGGPQTPALRPIAPNYQTAMQHLASVRLRLLRTDCLSKDAEESIEVLTLALLHGSDQ